jgi:two-component system CheB/CheR fusion protein
MIDADPIMSDGTLVRAMRALARARTMDQVGAVIREHARRLLNADAATFVVREGDNCYYADEDAIAPLWKGRRFPASACASGWAIQQRQPVAVHDIYQDARLPLDLYRPTFIKSLAIVPVREDDPVAAIGAYWSVPHLATRDEMDILRMLADGAALAVNSVQLSDAMRVTALRAQESQRQANDFLATVAHELSQPVTAIAAAAATMERLISREADERARAVIVRQAGHLARMIDDLLDAARVQRGTFELRRTPLDVVALVSECIDAIRPRTDDRRQELTFLSVDSFLWVDGDPSRLRQIVSNLLDNAVKYTPAGGKIDVQLSTDGSWIEIQVRDSGRGISPDNVASIFDLFVQEKVADEAGGLGIGLSVVRRLTEAHGGTVDARSAGVGLGSTFTVRLPACVEPLQPISSVNG